MQKTHSPDFLRELTGAVIETSRMGRVNLKPVIEHSITRVMEGLRICSDYTAGGRIGHKFDNITHLTVWLMYQALKKENILFPHIYKSGILSRHVLCKDITEEDVENFVDDEATVTFMVELLKAPHLEYSLSHNVLLEFFRWFNKVYPGKLTAVTTTIFTDKQKQYVYG